MKRREFVTGSIVAGAAIWLSPAAQAAQALAGGRERVAGEGSKPVAPMTREWFERLTGSTVELTQDRDKPVRATVAAVTLLPTRKLGRRTPSTDQFTVLFSLPAPAPLAGLCWMTNSDGARYQLFLGRVTDAGDRFLVRAHFSLLV